MNENTKKQKWIEQQQDKAVKVHHKNLDRIKKIEDKITTNLYRIYSLQVSMNLLEEQEDEQFEYGLDFLRQQAKKFALDIGEYQKNIGTNSKSSSWIACCAARDKEMLSAKYDKLFGQEDKK